MARRQKRDDEREDRIRMDIVVDANDSDERAMGWYYYLDNTLAFPFEAKCFAKRATSPLEIGETIEVISLPIERKCKHKIFVTIRWQDKELAVPLSQLKPSDVVDEVTTEAVSDWHYWVDMGYEF